MTTESIPHLLLDCTLARRLWRDVSDALQIPINGKNIILGYEHSPDINTAISVMEFGIYKYWLTCYNNNVNRNYIGLKKQLTTDNIFRIKVNSMLCKNNENLNLLLSKINNKLL